MSHFLIVAYTHYMYDGRVRRNAEALAERGDTVDVVCLASTDPYSKERVNVIGLEIPRYRGSSRTSYARSYLSFFSRAASHALRLGRKRRYDVIIVCTMPDAAVLCALPCRLLGSKILLDVHDTMPELYLDKFGGSRGKFGARLLMIEERLCAALADRVLAVHEPHADRLMSAGVSRTKISVVTNVPDPRIFAFRGPRPTAEGPFSILCHGTLTRRLGLDVAVEAIHLTRDRFPGVKLRIVGSGDSAVQIKKLIAQRRLESQVSMEDAVTMDRLPALFETADVGLIPNRASAATHLMLPVKLLEYATVGVPTISARLRTIEHYFGNEDLRYFAPDDSVSLCEAIGDLYLRPDVRARLARNARIAVERLNWQNQRQHYYQAVDSLLSKEKAKQ